MSITIWEREPGRWEAVVRGERFVAYTPMAIYEAMLHAHPDLRRESISIQPALPFPDEMRQ